jgi:intracellular sulfur oxidation DsrE/DsrF family protein
MISRRKNDDRKRRDEMKDEKQKMVGRRTLLTGMGVTAVAGLAASVASEPAQARVVGFEPSRHSKDAWMDEPGGNHRVFVDSSTARGGANAMRYASNIISAHEEEYEGSASDYAMIVCFRHASTPLAFDDAVWEKYGAMLDRDADPVPTANPMNTPSFSNGQTTLASLSEKGVKFAICNRATRVYASRLASATGTSPEAVYEELVAGAIPNSRFVPAGVLAVTRSQEYGYSLLYSE